MGALISVTPLPMTRLRKIKAEAYTAHITELLDNPEKIWSAAYHNQISNTARHVLLCLNSLGDRAKTIDLEPAFLVFHRACSMKYNFPIAPGDFRRGLQELDGSFLSYDSGVARFLNPSIRDFVASVILNEREIVQDLLTSAIRFKQVAGLWSLLISQSGEVHASTISADLQLFYASFCRLIPSPALRFHKSSSGGFEVHYIDTDDEGRVVFLMQLAERLRDAQSMQLAVKKR